MSMAAARSVIARHYRELVVPCPSGVIGMRESVERLRRKDWLDRFFSLCYMLRDL
jgi:hypothetical protein